MDNQITIFHNSEFGSIRTSIIEGIPLFCLPDVCRALDIKNSRNVKNRIDRDGVHTVDTIVSIEKASEGTVFQRNQKLSYIDEGCLYEVIFMSRKDSVKTFKRWVTNEVLPSIRKYGLYATADLVNNPDLLIEMASSIKQHQAEITTLKGNLVEFEKLMSSDRTFSISDVARFAGIGRNVLFEMLRSAGILMGDNAPYQRFMNRNPQLFKRIITNIDKDGKSVPTPVTRAYPAGVKYILNVIEKEMNHGR